MDVEVSNASTGIDGESIEYTYVLFDGMPSHGLEFRIQPRSILTVTDEWTGFKKPMDTDIGRLKEFFAIHTNDDVLMQAIFDNTIQDDLLFWTKGGKNRISDIRNYDGKVIYAVTGMLDDYECFRLLRDSAGSDANRIERPDKALKRDFRVATRPRGPLANRQVKKQSLKYEF